MLRLNFAAFRYVPFSRPSPFPVPDYSLRPLFPSQTLCQKLVGHFAYYGITGNSVALSLFRHLATGIWRRWLSRRRRDGTIRWREFSRFLKRYPLPPPIAIHSVYRRVART
jgi:hypothetical protein